MKMMNGDFMICDNRFIFLMSLTSLMSAILDPLVVQYLKKF